MQNNLRGNLNKYQSHNLLQKFLIRCFLKKIKNIVSSLPDGWTADIGCGEGFVLKDLLEQGLSLEGRIVGLDLDEKALEFASAYVKNIPFVRASVYQLPFQSKSFENLLILEVLEHLENPRLALVQVARVSQTMIISVPHEPFFQIGNFLRGKNLSRWGNDVEHIHHWNKKSLRELLKPYGTIIRLQSSFPWLIAVVRVF